MVGEIIVAVLALIGTVAGTYFSNRKSAALIEYRMDQLEEQVRKHNQVIERTYKLEGRMTEAEHDIKEIKNKHN